jgi:uncharacterized protein (TIGR02118 family)
MKLLFILFRRADLTHEQAVAEWSGPGHLSAVKALPGIRRWVLNWPITAPKGSQSDGVAELWFDSAETLEHAMRSPEMAAAVEDGRRFLDMERTHSLIVEEKTLIGQAITA